MRTQVGQAAAAGPLGVEHPRVAVAVVALRWAGDEREPLIHRSPGLREPAVRGTATLDQRHGGRDPGLLGGAPHLLQLARARCPAASPRRTGCAARSAPGRSAAIGRAGRKRTRARRPATPATGASRPRPGRPTARQDRAPVRGRHRRPRRHWCTSATAAAYSGTCQCEAPTTMVRARFMTTPPHGGRRSRPWPALRRGTGRSLRGLEIGCSDRCEIGC